MAVLTVTNTNDSGAGSLRQAVLDANAAAGADTITFAAGLAGATIVLTGGELSITDDTTIDGDFDGSADNKADIIISGNDASRIFNVSGAGTDVSLDSLTLTKGNSGGYGGGAIYTASATTLTIADTTIKDSAAGASTVGGGIFASGHLTVINSAITGNTAGGAAGVFLYDSFSGQASTLTNTTIDGNVATGAGGGIVVGAYASLVLTNSTVTNNSGSTGGGIATYSSVKTYNTVVAMNSASSGGIDVNGYVGTSSNSVFGSDVDGVTNGVNNNLEKVSDVGLGALGDHGGTVETRNIEAGSVLINAGSNALAGGILTDANGNDRVVTGTVDVGATEFQLVVTTALDVVADDGLLSLREAIDLANADAGADTITFDASLKGQTITLNGTELELTNDVTIDGDVDGDNKADITISGNNASRIFNMTGATTDVDLLSLSLSNGTTNLYGGAIYALNIATLDMMDTAVIASSAIRGGGLSAHGTNVTLTNSLVAGNSADKYGGGIYAGNSTLTVTYSTIHGNTANVYGGGFILRLSTLNLLNSTVTGNQADADGTATANGGGIFQYTGSVHVANSVVAENSSGTGKTANDVLGIMNTANNSFFSTTVSFSAGSNNINNGGDPMLGELLDNGGTVLTRSPLDGSPLIGAGNNALLPTDTYDIDHDGNTAETLPLDGREGLRLVGGTVDIGTVEQIEDEVINGTPGRNTIIGGLGVDTLNGRGGRDIVRGGDGDDTVFGGRGLDFLTGGNGRDKLFGGGGKDSLNGGANSDILVGGAGDDRFVFSKVAHSAQGPGLSDVIKDFVQGEDVIDVASAFAFNFLGAVNFTGAVGDLIQRISGSDLLVLGDTDGDKKADFRIILEGASGLTLNNGDFFL